MHRLVVTALLLSLTAFIAPASAADDSLIRIYATHESFDDAKQDVELAITGRGFFVDHTQHISDMLDRTGKDVGDAKKVYGKAESLQFCSAVLSRRMMEADPQNIVFCPYIISLYTLPADPKTVYVGYRRPPQTGSPASRAVLKQVDELLDGIVREALDIKN